MFKKKKLSYEEQMRRKKLKIACEALSDILKTEVKLKGNDNVEKLDSAATLSAVKMKARIALDFVQSLDSKSSSSDWNG